MGRGACRAYRVWGIRKKSQGFFWLGGSSVGGLIFFFPSFGWRGKEGKRVCPLGPERLKREEEICILF